MVSEVFRAFLSTSEDFRKFSKSVGNRFENFPTFSDLFRTSEDFRRLPTISEDLIKMLEGRLEHFATISDFFRRFPKTFEDFRRLSKISEDFRRFPKTSEDFRRFSKISESCRNVCYCSLRSFFLSFPKNIQTFNKGDTNPYFR